MSIPPGTLERFRGTLRLVPGYILAARLYRRYFPSANAQNFSGVKLKVGFILLDHLDGIKCIDRLIGLLSLGFYDIYPRVFIRSSCEGTVEKLPAPLRAMPDTFFQDDELLASSGLIYFPDDVVRKDHTVPSLAFHLLQEQKYFAVFVIRDDITLRANSVGVGTFVDRLVSAHRI